MFGLNDKNEMLNLSDFLIGVGQLRFRGTSVLFRLTKPIGEFINLLLSCHQRDDEFKSHLYFENRLVNFLNPKLASLYNNNINNNADSYELATHAVKVKRTGTVSFG